MITLSRHHLDHDLSSSTAKLRERSYAFPLVFYNANRHNHYAASRASRNHAFFSLLDTARQLPPVYLFLSGLSARFEREQDRLSVYSFLIEGSVTSDLTQASQLHSRGFAFFLHLFQRRPFFLSASRFSRYQRSLFVSRYQLYLDFPHLNICSLSY